MEEDQQEQKEDDVDEIEDLFNDEELASDDIAASESKPEDKDGKLHELIKNGNIYKMKVDPYRFDLSTIQSALNKWVILDFYYYCSTFDNYLRLFLVQI